MSQTDFNLNVENFVEGDPDAYKDQFIWMELIDDADFTYPLTTVRIKDDKNESHETITTRT